MIVRQLRKLSVAIVLLCAALFLVPAFGGTITGLQYTSSQKSHVGHGESKTVTQADGFTFTLDKLVSNGISFRINDLATNPDFWSLQWWNVSFAPSWDQQLKVGHYSDASNWYPWYPVPTPHGPQLNFEGNGRGGGMLTGYFDVLEITYDHNGKILSFAANFTQFDEGFQDWWNRGSIRYNSSVPLSSVPEPSALILMGLGLVSLISIARFHFGKVTH